MNQIKEYRKLFAKACSYILLFVVGYGVISFGIYRFIAFGDVYDGVYLFIVISIFLFIMGKNRLNRYYTYSKDKENGKIYLHNTPFLIFFYADGEKFKRLRDDALSKLERKFNGEDIYSETITLQYFHEKVGLKGTAVEGARKRKVIMDSYFITMCNLRNINKLRKKMFERIDYHVPKVYKINHSRLYSDDEC